MGRGRVQLKRIENKISRQVTFSKRRNGLLKKAHEISVLCDAEVALIIFSTKGKLFEYSTNSCMESILERYERCSHSERQVPNHCEEANWSLECHKLMARTEVLQRNLRNLAGEDLDPMSLRELQHLEQQIDTALKRIRSRKHQLYQESISDLQKKERALNNQNNILTQQLTENGKTLAEHAQWKQQNLGQNSSASIMPLLPLPSLTIGGNLQTRDFMIENEEAVAQTQQPYPTQMPSWMLRHVNE